MYDFVHIVVRRKKPSSPRPIRSNLFVPALKSSKALLSRLRRHHTHALWHKHSRAPSPCLRFGCHGKSGTASARTTFRVLASDTFVTIGWEVNHPSAVRFNVQGANDTSMLRAIASHVACNIQTSVGHLPPPPMLRPCCDLCCVQHPTSVALLPLLDTNPNITCLQHRNSTSTTLKFNVCNIQHQEPSSPSSTQHPTSHICNIETQQLQHQKLMFATSNITFLKHQDSTSATSKINATYGKIMQHRWIECATNIIHCGNNKNIVMHHLFR
jgi:hypothetical protein